MQLSEFIEELRILNTKQNYGYGVKIVTDEILPALERKDLKAVIKLCKANPNLALYPSVKAFLWTNLRL